MYLEYHINWLAGFVRQIHRVKLCQLKKIAILENKYVSQDPVLTMSDNPGDHYW